MNNNFFNDEDASDEVFRDIPDETVEGQQAPPVSVRSQPARTVPVPTKKIIIEAPPEEPVYEASEEDEDFTSVLSDARLRLEQGRLYEMIMNHDLFQGADADPSAAKFVQRQIRNFAKEQMEIMLGMRQEQSRDGLSVALPFNALEVEALKALAAAATGNASRSPEAEAETYEAPVAKKTGLNPIGARVKLPTKPKQVESKPLANKPAAPMKRTKMDATMEQILREEGVTREELEATFPSNYKPLDKAPQNLTPEEILERNRQAKSRVGTAVKASNSLPMPTQEQEEMMYAHRANQAANNPQMQSIMTLLNNAKKK